MSTTGIISRIDVRGQFPILTRTVNGKPLAYLDNAATTQKPMAVLDAIVNYYSMHNANVHRGAHTISAEATDMFEKARLTISRFVNAYDVRGVVFTKGTTEAINLVASAWGQNTITRGDVIVVTELEHHANIVPWQLLCERTGAVLKVIPVRDDGYLAIDELEAMYTLGSSIKLVAFAHVSNTLGTFTNAASICAWARERDITTLVDGAQAVAHLPVDVQAIGCDFYVFSGHKLYAPTGCGVLVARPSILEAMPPYQGGGAMIDTVTFEKTTYAAIPGRFEAGTPHVEGAVGLGAAIDWYNGLDHQALYAQEDELLAQLHTAILSNDGARVLGPTSGAVGVVSFVVDGVHPGDIGELLDQQGVAIRVGHHCTQPLMRRLGVTATARASVAAYTNEDDVAAFANALKAALRILR